MSGFTAFPKIPRLYKDVAITEKIDGTNGGIRIHHESYWDGDISLVREKEQKNGLKVGEHWVFAQSRTREITPDSDNHGFAAWIQEHAEKLVETLGVGVHFGEWWGSGINRGYGLQKGDKRFSLFNRTRWGHFDDPEQLPDIPGIGVVPSLYDGPMSLMAVDATLEALSMVGSYAAPGFMNPEGVVLFHSASNHLYKVTFDGDKAKGGAAVGQPPPKLALAAVA